MIATIPKITVKDETNDFDDKEFKDEYEKIHRDAEEYTTPLLKALNELPVYFHYHHKKGLVLGKGLKIVRYQTFIKKIVSSHSVRTYGPYRQFCYDCNTAPLPQCTSPSVYPCTRAMRLCAS